MLGHSNAGKTTYIAAMYGLMRSGYRGFRVRATDEAQDRDLAASARAIRSGRYPPPSSRRDEHSFELTYQGRRIADFTWTDYRGGALGERASDAETAAVLAELGRADGLVLFVDAARLAAATAGDHEVRWLTVLLQRAIGARSRSRTVPVVLACTKADLVSGADAWSRAVAPIRELAGAITGSPRVAGVTVAVSCGRTPLAVHVPVLWCVSQHLSARVAELRAEVERGRRLSPAAGSGAGMWNSLVSTLDGSESEHRRHVRLAREARERLEELEPLEEPAGKLITALRGSRASLVPPFTAGLR